MLYSAEFATWQYCSSQKKCLIWLNPAFDRMVLPATDVEIVEDGEELADSTLALHFRVPTHCEM
jgi:hypothetical protein